MNVLIFKSHDYYFIVISERRLITYHYGDINEILAERDKLKEWVESVDSIYFTHVTEKEMNELKGKQICEIPYDVFFSENLEKEFPELFV